MSSSLISESSGSAQIFQFPPRGRFALRIVDAAAAQAQYARGVHTVAGGAWYHDEAIRDARQSPPQPEPVRTK